jgi:serpin B
MSRKIGFPVLLALLCAMTFAAAAESDRAGIVKGNNQFAFDLYRRLADKPGNLLFSPYSISTALAMTSAGAKGKTAEEMQTVLHFPPQEQLHPALATIINDINGPGQRQHPVLGTPGEPRALTFRLLSLNA